MVEVYVFGSNLAGRHGKGSALYAKKVYGAVQGAGQGRQGNAYAIPTKDHQLNVRPLSEIAKSIEDFAEYARESPDDTFVLSAVGTGLAGYSRDEMWALFQAADLPPNVKPDVSWVIGPDPSLQSIAQEPGS